MFDERLIKETMAGAEDEAGLVSDADAGVRRAYRKRSESRKVSAPSVGTTAVVRLLPFNTNDLI